MECNLSQLLQINSCVVNELFLKLLLSFPHSENRFISFSWSYRGNDDFRASRPGPLFPGFLQPSEYQLEKGLLVAGKEMTDLINHLT